MPTPLPAWVVQDPSDGFRLRPPPRQVAEFDVRISFDVMGEDRIRARMSGAAVPTFAGGDLDVELPARPNEVRSAAASLIGKWKHFFVDFHPPENGRPVRGRNRPWADAVDLTAEPEDELAKALFTLAEAGAYVLFEELLGGEDPPVEFFRAQVAEILAKEGLRVRFDSRKLFLPWPMLCLRPDDLPNAAEQAASDQHAMSGQHIASEPKLSELFTLFLGFRHQIEHAGDFHPHLQVQTDPPSQPAVSLNHDTTVGRGIGSVAELAVALRTGTRFTPRTTYYELARDLRRPDVDEQLMYFWCHGGFTQNGSELPQLAVRLTDKRPFDAHDVDVLRGPHKKRGFSPFVVLNACHAGTAAADVDRAFLCRALIRHGAQGVLGPQIEMPQRFAADYALAFVQQYLRGGQDDTAGRIAHRLAQHFATRYRNPLGFAYGLHSGMDMRISRSAGSESDGA